MASAMQSVRDRLAEVDAQIEHAERRATTLRNELSCDGVTDLNTVSQLSHILDEMLQLKLSRDLLVQFLAFDRAFARKKSSKNSCVGAWPPRRRQIH
jgi:hypothetical protein